MHVQLDTRGPFTRCRLLTKGGCDWSIGDAYSSLAPDRISSISKGPYLSYTFLNCILYYEVYYGLLSLPLDVGKIILYTLPIYYEYMWLCRVSTLFGKTFCLVFNCDKNSAPRLQSLNHCVIYMCNVRLMCPINLHYSMATIFKLRSELVAPHRGNSDFSKLVTNFENKMCLSNTNAPISAYNYSEDGQADKDIYPDICIEILSKVLLMSNMKALTNFN